MAKSILHFVLFLSAALLPFMGLVVVRAWFGFSGAVCTAMVILPIAVCSLLFLRTGRFHSLACTSALIGILLVIGGSFHYVWVEGVFSAPLAPMRETLAARRVAIIMMILGALVGIGGTSLFALLSWKKEAEARQHGRPGSV